MPLHVTNTRRILILQIKQSLVECFHNSHSQRIGELEQDDHHERQTHIDEDVSTLAEERNTPRRRIMHRESQSWLNH